MDISTHSTASSSQSQPQQQPGGSSSAAAAPSAASTAAGANPSGNPTSRKPPPSREQSQLAKLREANAKYKQLLKLAKGRIQEQEGLLDERRSEAKQLTTQLNDANQQIDTLQTSTGGGTSGGGSSPLDLNETTILHVCQRIKEEVIDDSSDNGDPNDVFGDVMMDTNDNNEDSYEIWALIEYETANDNDTPNNPLNTPSFRRHKQWQCFPNESALSDYIRRDTGEPLTLPPYSLSPEQSQKMADEAKKAVSSISEEFRRFRVRAEVAKKQADATVRALHTNSVQTTRMRIEGQDIESELAQAKTDHVRLTALRAEMAEQESRWKESYDLLLAENEKLKSSGAEALLAAQWRHRYEACLKEKDDAITNWNMEKEKVMELQDLRKRADAGKYESKYRDLKESFRLYRKKAKEIFLAQQQGETGFMPSLHDSGAEVAKISYLKNLMVNYLSADPAVREHMEPAIGTVLNFTEDDLEKVKKQKEQNESWF
mmetsp:Transcript_35537/g.64036  ORF Transcript_35537/g.64036 Transcript_35537/m.64036 type:complete len:487 (-) Transcript_35537:224-1684(-)